VVDLVPGKLVVVRQAPWPWDEAPDGAVDAFIPASGIILEADGRRWHTRVQDFERDRWRDNQAAAQGLRVLRFTWLHLTEWVPEVVDVIDRAVRTPLAAA
jgi:very-short-patch-repair endonuclease